MLVVIILWKKNPWRFVFVHIITAINRKRVKGLNVSGARESDEAPQLQDKWISLNQVAFCSSLEQRLTYQGMTHGYGLSPFLFSTPLIWDPAKGYATSSLVEYSCESIKDSICVENSCVGWWKETNVNKTYSTEQWR